MARSHAAASPTTEPSPARGGRGGVSEIQRTRIIAALAELVHEGRETVTVAHVVTRSGVSRRTFYELFDDREDCLLAAFDRALARAAASVAPAHAAAATWREGIAGALKEALAFLDAEPELGYLCVVGALAAGPAVLERRAEVVERLVDAINRGRRECRAGRSPDRLVAEGVLGAVLTVVHNRLQRRDPRPLLALHGSLMAMIVLPYLGAQAAEAELKRRRPRPPVTAKPAPDPLRKLDMRLTYRTVRVLEAIADRPASSNRQIATAAGVNDQGQISRLLARLQALGLIDNATGEHAKGEPNAWSLTDAGRQVAHTLQAQAA